MLLLINVITYIFALSLKKNQPDTVILIVNKWSRDTDWYSDTDSDIITVLVLL